MSTPDPYKVLQVDPEAEDEVIEAAYRRLARKYHPDVAPGPDAQERMVRLNQAWELLRDPIRRAAVDRARVRAAADASRVSAADAQARTGGAGAHPRHAAGPATPSAGRASSGRPVHASGAHHEPGWPIPGMRDPSDEAAGHATDVRFAGAEAPAGPPPGNPSGSVLGFGRYAGWSLGEIARFEIGYLEWLDRMPIGRAYRQEIDALLRRAGMRVSQGAEPAKRGLFRR